jgi:tRNA wybutosine-synthesizing protein 5
MNDINFPKFFEDEEEFFSSVFRISSQGIRLWTHYDVNTLLNFIILIIN